MDERGIWLDGLRRRGALETTEAGELRVEQAVELALSRHPELVAVAADPCLRQRIAAETEQIERVRGRHARRVVLVSWRTEEPVGPARLLAWRVARSCRRAARGHSDIPMHT